MKRRLPSWFLVIGVLCLASPARAETESIDLKALAKKARPAVMLLVVSDANGKEIATGTGFLVSSDGKLITNHHVIENAASAVAKAENGGLFPVEGVLADDPKNDLVLLKIKGKDLPFLPLGNNEKIEVGTRIAVIGSPLGLEGTLSEGIVSAVRELPSQQSVLQITAAISPGSSGSPVLNAKGEVVGVATALLREGQSLNFAIPVEIYLKDLLARGGSSAKVQPLAATAKPEEQGRERQRIEQQTSELRGLPFKTPIHYKMIKSADLRRVLVEKIKEQYTEQELHDYGRTLATLGLVPEGVDLLDIIVSLYGEQVAAFYDPDQRALYTFKDLVFSSNVDKMLLSHELTHALQDQNFDLQKFPLKVKNNDDLALATSALIEGDATVLMTRWYVENVDPGKMLGDMGAIFTQNTAKLREAPAYLREMLLFPYQQGQQFAMTLFASGGIEALDAAFRSPPTCTKDILHPDQFLRQRAAPERLALPPLKSADWRLIGNNVLGEFGTRFVLQQGLGMFEAQMLAQGWNGDRYHVYERGTNGPTALVWSTAWNDEQHAVEFENAYKKVAEKRTGDGPPSNLRIRRAGKRVTIRQSSEEAFFTLSEAAITR